MNGCDAVVSSLGTGLSPLREVSLLTVATGALVTAMTRNGVRHLVCISALGVGDSRGHGGFVFDRLFLPLLLSHACKDKDGQEGDSLDRLAESNAAKRIAPNLASQIFSGTFSGSQRISRGAGPGSRNMILMPWVCNVLMPARTCWAIRLQSMSNPKPELDRSLILRTAFESQTLARRFMDEMDRN